MSSRYNHKVVEKKWQTVWSEKKIFQTTSQTATPGDPTGEIGRDYYFASWNSAFRFFNLDGSPASPATSLNSLFGLSF